MREEPRKAAILHIYFSVVKVPFLRNCRRNSLLLLLFRHLLPVLQKLLDPDIRKRVLDQL